MRRATSSAFVLIMLAVFFLPFSAVGEDNTNYFKLKGGMYSPESDDLEDFDEGFAGEIAFGQYLHQNFALELGLGYLDTDGDVGFTADEDITIIPLTLSAKAIFPVGQNFQMFGLAGGGFYFADGELDISGGASLDDDDSPLGAHLGLGIDYNITGRLSFGVEGKYFWTKADFKDAGIDFDSDLDGLIVTAGLTYYFGGEKTKPAEVPKDSDGDGVYDDLDVCPGTPPGVKVDSSGCPLDSDGDGVYDYMDECPKTPTGVTVDQKGCPLDSDGDGVYDYMDKCPKTPGGVKVDSKGCPLDTDKDGVYDHLDKCPDTPSGATVDQRGCWVLKGVNFDTAKWDIKSADHKILDEVVSILKKNPLMKLEIQGHTDNRGAAKYNQWLSEKRAAAVMEYLAGQGVGKSRLNAKGYGLSEPAFSNETPEGRAQNRRVELKPIL